MSEPRARIWRGSTDNPYLEIPGNALDEPEDDFASLRTSSSRNQSPFDSRPTSRSPRHETSVQSGAPATLTERTRLARPLASSVKDNPSQNRGQQASSLRRDYSGVDRLARARMARQDHDARVGSSYAKTAHRRARPASQKVALPAQSLRFWRWFRTIPIVCMVLMACASTVVTLGLFGIDEFLYPLHYESFISEAADTYGVDPLLVASIIRTESAWDPKAISRVGAVGLMQLLPETARELAESGRVDSLTFDPKNLTDPATNITYGTAYLDYCLENTDSLDQAIAAYNAGIGAANQWASTDSPFAEAIQYPETTAYLERVLDAFGRYQKTYPDGISSSSGDS